jgi:hypothetical protein
MFRQKRQSTSSLFSSWPSFVWSLDRSFVIIIVVAVVVVAAAKSSKVVVGDR